MVQHTQTSEAYGAAIRVEGARQNNLRNLTLEFPLNKLIVVTGVSGSGKSSLAFDTIYSEGQRRYVETFSAYTRQFLDRMDKPQVDRIEGIPPAIAIDQTNPVRTSRSTVGTMTELNDHLKLLFARAATLYCRSCGREVRRDTPQSILDNLEGEIAGGSRVMITFTVPVPTAFDPEEIIELLGQEGYTHVRSQTPEAVEVIQDRTRHTPANRQRLSEDLEAAMHHGKGRVAVHVLDEELEPRETRHYSADLHCAACDIHYREPLPNFFSFNSPMGACDTCRGFGRVIGIDYDLVVPDKSKTLAEGAVRPWQSESYGVCQTEMMHFARTHHVRTDVPWSDLTAEEKAWVIEGEGPWEDGEWYGIRRFFDWLESKSYKMHIRVLLSKYRTYTPCPDCGGARLKPEPLLWRLSSGGEQLNIHEIMLLPVSRAVTFFDQLDLPRPLDEAVELLLAEIATRLGYLLDVGLGYLTLDRQSRTLSGGEVQRINLTTALGTSLVNALFVLDEPSIGLHSRDIGRLIRVLHRLRDAGNTLIVVEHDPELIEAADLVLDLGPDAGAAGGKMVFYGTPDELGGATDSVTGRYLGRRTAPAPRTEDAARAEGSRAGARPAEDSRAGAPRATSVLSVRGAAEHNLRSIDVDIPLGMLVCVTGVSGSGKSTLVQDVLYNAIRMETGAPVEQPGAYEALSGLERIDDVVMVDQSPIGKTTRSNPASYVGAFDEIRKLFAREPLARERGYTAGTFSFNSGDGRCPTCGGNGFEHVEMQFLSDVYLRCPECNGTRYRSDVLDVKLLPPETAGAAGGDTAGAGTRSGRGLSIADVLELTVDEAVEVFSFSKGVARRLEPLRGVGLGYVTLGQPVPTLSGGEAQRLKLAGHLADANRSSKRKHDSLLFLFDEPTTGLHFRDIEVLLQAFRRLVEAGHSVVVIEHNLDVIASADWILDLGPEGGEAGGELVAGGPPARFLESARGHTAEALRRYLGSESTAHAADHAGDYTADPGPRLAAAEAPPPPAGGEMTIRGAREHNLRDIDLTIPRDELVVITGVSGSGKSTVAFDIVFGEGQRRYLESLNAYARQFVQPSSRPDVESVTGVPPTVAIEQRTSRGANKSTVATVTEVYHFLRLLFVKLGTQYCPTCSVPIEPQSVDSVTATLLSRARQRRVTVLAPLVTARKGYYTDLASWAAGKGFAYLRVDGELLETAAWPRLDRFHEHTIQAPVGDVVVEPANRARLRALLERAAALGKGVIHVLDGETQEETVYSTERSCPVCGRGFEELDPRMFSFNSRHGWCPECKGTGLAGHAHDDDEDSPTSGPGADAFNEGAPCTACGGTRLRPEARFVFVQEAGIYDVTKLAVANARERIDSFSFTDREGEIARDILAELGARLSFLERVGLGYLPLDRAAPTLSGGEAQRIRLAAQLGSNLRGVAYVLDEPTIGLHARDNRMLLDTLHELKAKGNSILLVEHDEDTIRSADYVIDLGPGGGVEGGAVVAEGTLENVLAAPGSVTARFLERPPAHPMRARRHISDDTDRVTVRGATLHNLRGVDVSVPLGRLVCVTGVSGSGKSSLVRDIMHRNLRPRLGTTRATPEWVGCSSIDGYTPLDYVREVDQTPIGKTPRSCPATYVGFWDEVRRLFAGLPESRMRGYTAGRFSFNTADGRCPECGGQGLKRIEMSFLPDVSVVCDRCGGRRFTDDTLEVEFKGKNIAGVLDMSVAEAVGFFEAHPAIHRAVEMLRDVGLGYLKLGQQSPTLSGGEAQRIKLVTELAKARSAAAGNALYILDEPTIGLHMADVERLVSVLHRLVEAGNTVIVIEHNLEVVAEADWVIDLGPEGGDGGGSIVAEGTPEQIVEAGARSWTGRFLEPVLRRSEPAPTVEE
ncbi:MAG: excinuclease ABC subunit UvrA [Spirochaetia bacterium]